MANEKKLDCVILGLLQHEDLTGYEIKKRLDTTLKFFWGASFGSIYPTLKELEQKGLATKQETEQQGRTKKLYSITPAGHIYLESWLALPVEKDELRYETLLKLFFGESAGSEISLGHIEAFEKKIQSELPYLQNSVETLSELQKQAPAHLYYLLTAQFGMQVYTAYLSWCKQAKKALKEQKNG